jgi:DNA repair exonuclease SbcCD ATPase subunit
MKKVVLKSITMRNFRGEKERTTNFNDVETTIMGDNGLGKSRHFDAFVWLLFGKDTKDRKDFNIKTLVDGKPLERVNCEVSCVLDVDGETINLRRVYAEKWVKPRGQVEERFEGHEHELFWNDVPLKVGEYQSRINTIINDSVFKMITNPLFFANMKWQEQREVLFQLAGTITDNEIAAQKPEYAALMDKITGKSLSDFKREISARKKKLKEELDGVQPRIDQTQKLMPAATDFAALEVEIESLEKQRDDVDKAINDKTAAVRQQYEGVQKKQGEINKLKEQRQQVLHDAKTAAKDAAHEANASRRNLESNIRTLESEIASLERSIQSSERELKGLNERREAKNNEVETKRKEWNDENAREYNGDDTCHECGQPLPEERRADARKLFDESKQKKLADINKKGREINAEIEQLDKDIAQVNKTLETGRNDLKTKQGNLDTMNKELANMPTVGESDVNPEDLPEHVELSAKITKMEANIDNGAETIDTTELQTRKREITTKIDEAKSELKNRELIDKYQGEIKDLDTKGKQLAQQIADVEREEYAIQGFTKAKIDECERRINGLFTMVTFRLFEYTIEGNESETCVPLVAGVPFGAANTAGQVNAGLDIINALVRFHGVSAPIFIDGRESVNRLIHTESQIINLVVSHDKSLIIK